MDRFNFSTMLLLCAALAAGCTGPGGTMAPSWNDFWHHPDHSVARSSAPPAGQGARRGQSPLACGVSPLGGAFFFGRI